MNGISKIELGLENCEVITIDGKYIGAFDVSNIQTHIRRMGCNYIGKYNSCESFAIEIHRSGNTVNKPFGIEDVGHNESIFDRLLKYRDITSVTVYYDKKNDKYEDIDTGEKADFYVPYEDEVEGALGSPNVNQKCYINSFGDLYILISKNETLEDYFDMDEIEDEDMLSFHFSMLDIEK